MEASKLQAKCWKRGRGSVLDGEYKEGAGEYERKVFTVSGGCSEMKKVGGIEVKSKG